MNNFGIKPPYTRIDAIKLAFYFYSEQTKQPWRVTQVPSEDGIRIWLGEAYTKVSGRELAAATTTEKLRGLLDARRQQLEMSVEEEARERQEDLDRTEAELKELP